MEKLAQSATQYILARRCAEESGLTLSFCGKRYSLKTELHCVCRAKRIETVQAFLDGVKFARGEGE